MGLTQKILLFTSALVIALVATTLAFTTRQADRLAQQTLRQALAETSEVWDTFQADRYAKLRLGIRVLGNAGQDRGLVARQSNGVGHGGYTPSSMGNSRSAARSL